MSTEANKAIVRRNFEEVWNQHNPAAIDALFAPDYRWHVPGISVAPGVAGVKQLAEQLFAACPDIRFTIEDQLADGDKVITRFTNAGTHRGEFMGIAATGKRLTNRGIIIDRIVDGKIAESWEEWDALGFLQQTGAVPVPEQATA